MSRIERLLKLAQKTGDTLIIHDEQGRDMVVMDVNMYEVLHDMYGMGRYDDMAHDDCCHACDGDHYDHHHDYDIPFGPVDDGVDDWHRAGDVLDDRHGQSMFDTPWDDEDDDDDDDWYDFDDKMDDSDDIKVEDIPFPFSDNEIKVEDIPFDVVPDMPVFEDNEPQYDDLAEASIPQQSVREEIPFVSHDHVDIIGEERPLDDEDPVFFEEPV